MSINYTELKEVIERDMIPKSVLEQIRAEIDDYLYNNDLDKHIEKIKKLYKSQANAMVSAMEEYFPSNVNEFKDLL